MKQVDLTRLKNCMRRAMKGEMISSRFPANGFRRGAYGIIVWKSGVRHIHLLSASNDIAAYPYAVAEFLP